MKSEWSHSCSSNALIGILIAGCLGFLTGCSTSTKYIPFTTDMIHECNLTTNDFENLQYYVSEKILLHRELGTGNSRVASGKLIIRNGKSIDEVEVLKYAPGIATNVDSIVDHGIDMHMSFEENSATLLFRAFSDLDGRHEFSLVYERFGSDTEVEFDNLEYQPLAETLNAKLLIDKETYNKMHSKLRILPGRLLHGTSR